MPTPTNRNRRKRWIGGTLGATGLGMLLCGLGGFFLVAKMFHDDSAKLPTDLDIARQEGLPLTADDIHALVPDVPDSQNAAPIYRKAIAEYAKLKPHKFVRNPRRQTRAEWLKQTERDLQAFEPTMQLIRQAAKLPYCDFHNDLSHGFDVVGGGAKKVFPEELAFPGINANLTNSAFNKLRNGDIDGTFADLELQMAVAKHASQFRPVFSGQWVVYAQANVMYVLWRMLNTHMDDPALVTRIERFTERIELPDLYKLMETDFVLGRGTIHNLKSFEDVGLDRNTPEAFNRTVDALYQSPGVKDAFDANFVKTYIKFFRELPKDREDWPRINAVMKQYRKKLDEDHGVESVLTRQFTPAYPYIALEFGEVQAEQRLILTSIRLVRIRERTSEYPKTLPDMGAVSIDPLSGKQLHYRREADGFTLYSVGRNMKDDGGLRWRPGMRGYDDIVFRFPQLGPQRLTSRL